MVRVRGLNNVIIRFSDYALSAFSTFKSVNAPQVEDPAIASIGQPPMGRRGGGAGFGEGFGFGGGIGGGRGIGKGARNIGYAPFEPFSFNGLAAA